MQNNITSQIIQQLILISVIILVNVYYYHRLDVVFNDQSVVKKSGAIEQLKSQIASQNNTEQFIHCATKSYVPIGSLKRVNAFSLFNMKEHFDQTTPTESQAQTPTQQQAQANVVNCQEMPELFPQKNKSFNITGTKLDDFQEMFNNIQKLSVVCKQQIPIGSIIPFAYYYQLDDKDQYKLLLDEQTQNVSNTQILLRKTDNLVLVPLLGGTLTKVMVQKVLGQECEFVKAMFGDKSQINLPNTDKKVMKQTTTSEHTNLDDSAMSGKDKIIQKIKKATMFFHDLQTDSKWSLANGGMYYTAPPANHTIKVKRGGISKKNSSYMQDQSRDEKNTTTHYSSQELQDDVEINIEDPYGQAMFCMVIGYI